MMIKFKIFFILFFVFTLKSYGQESNIYNDLTQSEIEWLSENKNSIKYAPNPFWPPMDYIDENGEHQGLISDYIKFFEQELEIDFQKSNFKNWDDLVIGLKNSETDFVGAIQKTKEREKYLLFSEPYLKTPLVIIVKNSKIFKNKNEINKMRLAIVKGYACIDFIRKNYPNAEIVECENDLSAMLKTSLGNTDGTVTDLMSASYVVEKYGINNLQLATELKYSWNICFACRKDLPELFSIVNKLLRKVDNKKRKKMYDKWININTLHKKSYFEKNLNAIIIITAIALFCLVLTLFFNIILKNKIKKRTEELYEAKIKAEESDLLKSAFLANMSHEIRTPMNGIIGFTTLLKQDDLTNEEMSLYIDIINKSGERLLNTINDIIDISKIDAQQMQITNEEVSINENIYDLYNFFKIQCDDNKVSLKLDISSQDVKIFTDRNKFNSILTNLIKNAIKFTETGEIIIGYKTNTEDYLFYVKDTGIGIPKERHSAVFNRFVQADIEDKNAFQGSGLGLSIAKAYIEMLEGKIWVESEINKGSTFYFTIPLDKTIMNNEEDEVASKEAENTFSKSNKKLKILIAEDDNISFIYLSTIISKLGHEIIHAKNGREAIDICKSQEDIDIILMDIKMPEIDGLEATMEIRKFNKSIQIIAQSAYVFEDDFINSRKVGCNYFLTKPVDKKELIKLIDDFINSKS